LGTEPRGAVELQLNSVSSVPAHVRPLIQMGPVPSPKAAAGKVLVTGNKELIESKILYYGISNVVCSTLGNSPLQLMFKGLI
jgi:hypothetical protein